MRINNTKKLLCIAALVLFFANLSGTLFIWHLFLADSSEHDCGHCPICQQLLISPGKIIEAFPDVVIFQHYISLEVEIISQNLIEQIQLISINPRAPPY
ncbi:hypothetical protein [Sedimentisphaera cyanobacteriorum]|uniref:hypothetical protein n=1 Tax=Sedimentisphaera cyanobacteriorum TaxID=1940790 RepID=UPI00098757B5|nr:hypothetical protein [Sedimentisphaera cyanobacteriorum]